MGYANMGRSENRAIPVGHKKIFRVVQAIRASLYHKPAQISPTCQVLASEVEVEIV